MLAAVILSGGSSSRMGSPKALVGYQGKAFLDHLLEVTQSSADWRASCGSRCSRRAHRQSH